MSRTPLAMQVMKSIFLFVILQGGKGHAFLGLVSEATRRPKGLTLGSSLSEDDDFALVGLNAEAPMSPFEVQNTQANTFGLQSAEDILASTTGENENSVAGQRGFASISTQRKEVPRSSSQEINDMGLTDDGDFILEGVNAYDPTGNKGLEKYGTPLIDPSEGAASGGDILSHLSLNSPQPQSTAGNFDHEKSDNLSGLTEDGDIALVGFNALQPAFSNSYESGMNQAKLLASLQNQEPVSDATSGPALVQRENSLKEVDDMTMWLLEIIPTLGDEDCIFYAEQLVSLGFHPDCVARLELQPEDLVFMKPLHQRFVLKTIQGEPQV